MAILACIWFHYLCYALIFLLSIPYSIHILFHVHLSVSNYLRYCFVFENENQPLPTYSYIPQWQSTCTRSVEVVEATFDFESLIWMGWGWSVGVWRVGHAHAKVVLFFVSLGECIESTDHTEHNAYIIMVRWSKG